MLEMVNSCLSRGPCGTAVMETAVDRSCQCGHQSSLALGDPSNQAARLGGRYDLDGQRTAPNCTFDSPFTGTQIQIIVDKHHEPLPSHRQYSLYTYRNPLPRAQVFPRLDRASIAAYFLVSAPRLPTSGQLRRTRAPVEYPKTPSSPSRPFLSRRETRSPTSEQPAWWKLPDLANIC